MGDQPPNHTEKCFGPLCALSSQNYLSFLHISLTFACSIYLYAFARERQRASRVVPKLGRSMFPLLVLYYD